ncbi:MAG: twin transmembrane helix small protein [Proteobacteria bacterium]|nr:twin transmembrane helix small protein [Pseudomonadota bacterium]MBW3618268.1 twin transmembrane helix small protein [Pseudomonadota bacterium]
MTSVLNVLLPIALGAVFITLCLGIYSLFRGGDFARSHSNKLMRLRVALQFVAVVVLMAAFYFSRQGA